eukprot:759261-Hanusia_phi.AAC.3
MSVHNTQDSSIVRLPAVRSPAEVSRLLRMMDDGLGRRKESWMFREMTGGTGVAQPLSSCCPA